MEEFHGCAIRLFPDNPQTPFHSAFVDQEMCTQGRYPYQPAFADRLIKFPIPYQTWITDAPGRHDGDSGRDSGDSRDDENSGDDAMDDIMGDQDRDACDAKPDDLSSTTVLKHPSQPGKWEGNQNNTADRSLQSNAHRSLTIPSLSDTNINTTTFRMLPLTLALLVTCIKAKSQPQLCSQIQ